VSGVDPSRGTPVSITLNGPVGGTGGLTKSGVDSLVLNGTNTYAGVTVVANGGLFVDGVSATNSITVSGGTLGGLGTIRGAVTIAAGGELSPGDTNTAMATLIISNRLTLGGTCSLSLDKSGGVTTSDLVTNITTLTIGGALQVVITGDTPLVVGDSFKIFSFNSASGAFTSINPSTPGDGLAWDTSSLTSNGTLKVIVAPPAAPAFGSVTLTGTNLVLNITNGVPGGTNVVLSTTNLAKPLNQWVPQATNLFDGNGNSLWTNRINPAKPREFYLIQLQ
jgi:autotransporter-associated beta strand protein